MDDLKRRTMRLIGDPGVCYREDPVRMLRASRVSAASWLQTALDTAARCSAALWAVVNQRAAGPVGSGRIAGSCSSAVTVCESRL